MCEFRKLDAIFLADERLVVSSFADIVDVDGFVRRRGHEERAFVVVVHGQDVRLLSAFFDVIATEELQMSVDMARCAWRKRDKPWLDERWK